MDITTLAAWGEFIGGIGVVVSLIYLASQIRQNSQLLRTSAASTTAHLHTSQNMLIAADSEVSRLLFTGCSDPGSLSPEGWNRFIAMIGFQVQGMHQSFEFHERGIGTQASWYWTQQGMRWFVKQPGFRTWWSENAPGYMPSFREYVAQLIRENERAD